MARTPLYDIERSSGATFTHLFDWEIADSFGDLASEYRATCEGVAVLDRSYVGRFLVNGKDSLDLLNRLSSYKVDILNPGTGAGTILTTNKGRIIDLLYIFCLDDGLLMLTSPQTRQRVAEWIDLYTFLEDVTLQDTTESAAMITVLGPEAPSLLEKVSNNTVSDLQVFESRSVSIAGIPTSLHRSDPVGSCGYDLIVSKENAEALWSAVTINGVGATPIGEACYNTLRIEAGIPRYGWEISEEVNPWEANLNQFIHFEKGCYVGQEVILRLDTYDKVQRHLMRLELSGESPFNGVSLQKQGTRAGTITSTVKHPVFGNYLGLGLIRTAYATDNTELEITGSNGEIVGMANISSLSALPPELT